MDYGYKNAPSKFAPPSPGAVGMGTHQARCKGCDAPLVFIRIEKKDGTLGSLMPCDTQQTYGDGKKHLVVRFERGRKVLGRLVTKAGPEVFGFEPHFGTCPPLVERRRIENERKQAANQQQSERETGRQWLDEVLGHAEQGGQL